MTPSHFSSSTTVLLICIILVAGYTLWRTIHLLVYHPLAKVPGPKLYALSGLPYALQLVRGNAPMAIKQLHEEYGPVVRYAPNDVSFISASAWRQIYGHRKAGNSTFDKDLRQYRESLTGASNILIANDADHTRMRRLLAHAFSEKALRGQQGIIKHYVDLLIQNLEERMKAGAVVDISLWYNFTTFDIIGDLCFGEPFGCLASGGYHAWVAMIFDGFRLSTLRHAIKRMPFFKHILNPFLPKSLIKAAREHLQLSFAKAKQRAERGHVEREDFMSYILRYNDEKGMTANEIGENSNILILAGSETTATLLSGITYHLLKRPDTYRLLVEEISSAFKTEEEIDLLAVNRLTYLAAVLKEGFRMYPPVPANLGRKVPKEGREIDGYWFPGDTVVSVAAWSAYQSSLNFHMPNTFCPERWLGDSRFDDDEKEVLQPFSFGPRDCIGKNLAYAEARLILVRTLWNFDLELMPDSINWNKQAIYLFWDKGPLNIKLNPRRR